MKPIVNIITNSKRVDFNLKYNKCKDLSDIDKSLPTIIIGYEKAKESIENFNILKKYYKEQNIWWTFSRTERMSDYNTDMTNFTKEIINKITEDIVYEYIDVMMESPLRKRKMIRYLVSNDKKVIYNHYGRFLFVYSPKFKHVWGLSLSTLKYFGYETGKLLKIIKSNKNNYFINNLNEISSDIRRNLSNDIHKQIVLYEYFGNYKWTWC